MNVVLVSSLNYQSHCDLGSGPISYVPLGLLSLDGALRKHGIECRVFEINTECRQIIASNSIPNRTAFCRSLAEKILSVSSQVDVVGFSTTCNSYHYALTLADECKRISPHVFTVFGGPQATATADRTLCEFPCVDYVVAGEAEISFPCLLHELSAGRNMSDVPGVLTRDEQGCVNGGTPVDLISDLDDLPFPSFDSIPMALWVSEGNPYLTRLPIEAGRGCPFRCSYCSTSRFWRRRFRIKSVPRILQEIDLASQSCMMSAVTFRHDIFTADNNHTSMLCKELAARRSGLRWSCSTRVDRVDESLLEAMASAGCDVIYYGVESGSPRIQETCGKRLDVALVVPRVKQTLRAGIKPMLSFILGFPEETEADVQLTFDLISHVLESDGAQVQLHLLTPLAGSQLYEQFGDDIELDTYFSDITYGVTSTDDLVLFRKHPEVFSSFYHFRTRDVGRNTYVGSDQFLYAASSELRHSIRALSLYFGGLWQAYCRWKEFTLSMCPENGFGSMSFADIISTVAAFSKHCAELKQEASYLNDLAQYEAVLYELGRRTRESGTVVSWKEACRAEPGELGLSQKARVKEFHFDIPAAIESLKSGSRLWSPKKKICHLLLLSTDIGRTTTLRMSRDTADALGRIAQGDSLPECLSSYSKSVRRAIQTLVDRGVIVKRTMESDSSCI